MKISTIKECHSILFDELFVELDRLTKIDSLNYEDETRDEIIKRIENLTGKCTRVAEFVEQEFFHDPMKTKLHVDFILRKMDSELVKSYDYFNDNVLSINPINDVDGDLELDLLFDAFDGEKIRERKLTIEQVNDYKSNHVCFTNWVLYFYNLLALAKYLNFFYNELNLSFESHDDLHDDSLFSKVDNISKLDIIDSRKNPNAPTNKEKIKALKELAPELWERLQKANSKHTQQKIIHAITGTNFEDSYKYSFGSRSSELKNLAQDQINALLDLIK